MAAPLEISNERRQALIDNQQSIAFMLKSMIDGNMFFPEATLIMETLKSLRADAQDANNDNSMRDVENHTKSLYAKVKETHAKFVANTMPTNDDVAAYQAAEKANTTDEPLRMSRQKLRQLQREQERTANLDAKKKSREQAWNSKLHIDPHIRPVEPVSRSAAPAKPAKKKEDLVKWADNVEVNKTISEMLFKFAHINIVAHYMYELRTDLYWPVICFARDYSAVFFRYIARSLFRAEFDTELLKIDTTELATVQEGGTMKRWPMIAEEFPEGIFEGVKVIMAPRLGLDLKPTNERDHQIFSTISAVRTVVEPCISRILLNGNDRFIVLKLDLKNLSVEQPYVAERTVVLNLFSRDFVKFVNDLGVHAMAERVKKMFENPVSSAAEAAEQELEKMAKRSAVSAASEADVTVTDAEASLAEQVTRDGVVEDCVDE